MPKESYEGKASFLAHSYLFHTIKDPYTAWCQLLTTDAYGKKVQCERSESKDSDCLKYFKHHRFDDMKAHNYMTIYKISAIDRVNIKLQYPEFTVIVRLPKILSLIFCEFATPNSYIP